MNSFKFCLFLVAISFLALSCQKEKVDPIPEPVLDEGILLEINEGENFYIGETGNHFYSNSISHENDSTLYKLKIKTGVKYHIYCLKPDFKESYIKMVLLNSEREIISESTNQDGKVEIFFTPSVDENLYLVVTIGFDVIKPIEYNLYFEELTPADLSFVGYNWETSGNWKVID